MSDISPAPHWPEQNLNPSLPRPFDPADLSQPLHGLKARLGTPRYITRAHIPAFQRAVFQPLVQTSLPFSLAGSTTDSRPVELVMRARLRTDEDRSWLPTAQHISGRVIEKISAVSIGADPGAARAHIDIHTDTRNVNHVPNTVAALSLLQAFQSLPQTPEEAALAGSSPFMKARMALHKRWSDLHDRNLVPKPPFAPRSPDAAPIVQITSALRLEQPKTLPVPHASQPLVVNNPTMIVFAVKPVDVYGNSLRLPD